MAFKYFKQRDAMDCGPTCLKMVIHNYGRSVSLDKLRNLCNYTREGVNLQGISDAAESLGFKTIGVTVDYEKLHKQAPFPFIAHWKQEHFVVVYRATHRKVHVADPAFGLIKYSREEFLQNWLSHEKNSSRHGVALLLEPSPAFFNKSDEPESEDEQPYTKRGFAFLFKYLAAHYRLVIQLAVGMLVGSLLQLLFPFFTQSVVDFGINRRDTNFLFLILSAQLMLFLSKTVVDFIRGWILLYIGQRINISLISDFLMKLLKMPIAFFDTKMVGDIMQRIGDHQRIEQFLTASTLNVLFSFFNLVIFGTVLAFYSLKIVGVFVIGSLLYAAWVVLFLKHRRELDFKRFNSLRQNQDSLFQMIMGMQEIKLYNSEKQKRWEWERIQARLFKISSQSLKLSQLQQAGAVFLNEGKNILITFLAAYSVIRGEITLGMMLSIQYIIGQLNSPIDQMISFMQTTQDAKISLERLSEIHNKPDEEPGGMTSLREMPAGRSLEIKNLYFHYPGMQEQFVLSNVSLRIPEGKITAIVGTSGSGKTTLLKLILGFYPPQKGRIEVGGTLLTYLSPKLWRSRCGVVMQDGYIFSDSIERNIALGEERIDKQKLCKAVEIANIKEYIESLPMGYQTKIGADGRGLSAGQKQRLIIARSVYKNPEYIFFDEATNALDANNEKDIVENLNSFFTGKTVLIVAHRLSTVKHADQIVVLEKGKIAEVGDHGTLVALKGRYYELVKNQLELGN
jgi:ATP-binding cassette subfamily B protein